MGSYRNDFVLPNETYLLSHSVGRPLKSQQLAFEQTFFTPWQTSADEPWAAWLRVIDEFCQALGRLFATDAGNFCPQVNLSSALTKVLMSHPRFAGDAVVLMSEQDFPSMGFAMRQALPDADIRFIPEGLDITDEQVWADWLTPDIDLVFISHVYSNTGECAPLLELTGLARGKGIFSVVDIAQSAGIIPLALDELGADFVLGSCVKWLCGGPGAAWLWVNPARVDECQPRDVGWFSHENPFEFDIHRFRYHTGALRFWGGTPSVAPYAIAAHSINSMVQLGVALIREHNQRLLDLLHQQLPDMMVSPAAADRRSGTGIITSADNQGLLSALIDAGFSLDCRRYGLRVSPHIYNTEADILRLVSEISRLHRG